MWKERKKKEVGKSKAEETMGEGIEREVRNCMY